MNENEKRPAETGAKDDNTIDGAKRQNRRMFLWVLCGAYLLYLAFQLLRGLARGEVASGAERVIAVGGGIAFVVIGVILLISAARLGLRTFKASVQSMAADLDAQEAAEALTSDEDALEAEDEDADDEEAPEAGGGL